MHKNTLLFNNARVLQNKAGLLENKAGLLHSGESFCAKVLFLKIFGHLRRRG